MIEQVVVFSNLRPCCGREVARSTYIEAPVPTNKG